MRSAMARTSSLNVSSGKRGEDESHLEGFRGAELLRGEEDLARPGRSDDAGQQPGPGHVAGDADAEEGGVEHRPLAGVAQVAGARPAESGSRAGAVDRGDGHPRHFVQQARDVEVLRPVRLLPFVAGVRLEVGARAEGASRSGKEDGAHVPVGCDFVQRLVELAHHPVGDAVQALGPVEGDGREGTVHFVEDGLARLVGHRLVGQSSGSGQAYQVDHALSGTPPGSRESARAQGATRPPVATGRETPRRKRRRLRPVPKPTCRT